MGWYLYAACYLLSAVPLRCLFTLHRASIDYVCTVVVHAWFCLRARQRTYVHSAYAIKITILRFAQRLPSQIAMYVHSTPYNLLWNMNKRSFRKDPNQDRAKHAETYVHTVHMYYGCYPCCMAATQVEDARHGYSPIEASDYLSFISTPPAWPQHRAKQSLYSVPTLHHNYLAKNH